MSNLDDERRAELRRSGLLDFEPPERKPNYLRFSVWLLMVVLSLLVWASLVYWLVT